MRSPRGGDRRDPVTPSGRSTPFYKKGARVVFKCWTSWGQNLRPRRNCGGPPAHPSGGSWFPQLKGNPCLCEPIPTVVNMTDEGTKPTPESTPLRSPSGRLQSLTCVLNQPQPPTAEMSPPLPAHVFLRHTVEDKDQEA